MPVCPALPVFRLQPPYADFVAVSDVANLRRPDLVPGSLLALAVSEATQWPQIREWVPWLRSSFPSAPVILQLKQLGEIEVLQLARRAGALHVRGILVAGEAVRSTLAPILTDPVDLASEVGEWLETRGLALGPRLMEVIGQIFRSVAVHSDVSGLLESMGRRGRTVRTWFRSEGVPGPAQWLAAARALVAALRLQKDGRTPLLQIAVECGYSDHSSLSRQTLRLFGARPGTIRHTLGWEWLLDRWLSRELVTKTTD